MIQDSRACQNCKENFEIDPDDFGFYETIKVPAPTFCPNCRLLRRMAWMGYRFLYKRNCNFSGEPIITAVHPKSPFKVYKQDIWWSDKWDPKSYAQEYDPERPFLVQFRELFQSVPMPSLYTEYSTMLNSEYCNAAAELKNCYLCFKSDYAENSAYLNTISEMKECFDIAFSNYSELSYDSVNITKCYQVFYSKNCDNSHNIYFSENLSGCSNCIGCINLRKKDYYIFNQPYSKEEYEKFLKNLNLGSYQNRENFVQQVKKEFLKHPRKEYYGTKNINISGDYISNSKNVHDSFMVANSENLRYCQLLKNGPAANCYDYTMFSMNAEWIYDSSWVGLQVNNIKFSNWCYKARYLEYCFGCHGSGNLFGCVGVRGGEYCILNKQYSKDEYLTLVEKIRSDMNKFPYINEKGIKYKYGEHLPGEWAPCPINETSAIEWQSLTKEKMENMGYWWHESDKKEFQSATMEIPDHINDVTDEVLKNIQKCQICEKNYQIIEKELKFYQKFQIPIPRECPLCRDFKRIHSLNPMTLYDRKCDKCAKNIRTSYDPNRPEIVYCEECYQQEII